MADVSDSCASAFETASNGINDHYATHPMYGPEFDALYEDGTISDTEQPILDAMIADEEAKFNAVVDPVYDACNGVEEFYAGAFAQKDNADWALAENEIMTREKNKKIFVMSYCFGQEARPACSDFVAEDWK